MSLHAGQAPERVPDFTAGDRPGETHDWTLGATGARGWIHTANGHSGTARQILVTAVAAGSPADGLLRVGDVILGTAGKPFADDARITFARALTTAEGSAANGRLPLLRWRAGVRDEVTLTLRVLGDYHAHAPYDCAKSAAILALSARALAQRMTTADYGRGMHPIARAQNALGLLATDDAALLPALRGEVAWAAGFSMPPTDYQSWSYGFVTMFLAEYVLKTGDRTVLPGLTRLALATANGQSAVGTWGHRFALPNGNLNGYGCMNQPGLSLCLGMVLARMAGVSDPVVDRAITRAAGFLRWYVHKGAVPYGDHLPFNAHEDNGKCSAAAVLFDVLGDSEATAFFARMATAAYRERERGHTGNYFNVLWALPGVARSGPLGTAAYFRETSWYYDLARGWDGVFLYQGAPEGEEESGAHKNWDCTGSYLLAYALSRRSLSITGRQPTCAPPLNAAEVDNVIAAGLDHTFKGMTNPYDRQTTAQLLAGLTSWSPQVRNNSAAALGRRQDDVMPQVLALLNGTARDARYGACAALAALGPRADAAAPALRALLHDPDPWLQSLACLALPMLGKAERTASVGDLLRMIVRPNPADPREMAQRAAAMALFSPYPGQRTPPSILAQSLDGVDRALLYPAVEQLLDNQDSVARAALGKLLDELTAKDLAVLLPAIVRAVEQMAPSNEMFADGIRVAGLDVLSRLHLREGMALCLTVLEPDRWGFGGRIKPCLDYLTRYGTHAQAHLPELRRLRDAFVAKGGKRVNQEHVALFDSCIATIAAATTTPTVVAVSEFAPKK